MIKSAGDVVALTLTLEHDQTNGREGSNEADDQAGDASDDRTGYTNDSSGMTGGQRTLDVPHEDKTGLPSQKFPERSVANP